MFHLDRYLVWWRMRSLLRFERVGRWESPTHDVTSATNQHGETSNYGGCKSPRQWKTCEGIFIYELSSFFSHVLCDSRSFFISKANGFVLYFSRALPRLLFYFYYRPVLGQTLIFVPYAGDVHKNNIRMTSDDSALRFIFQVRSDLALNNRSFT